MKVSLTTLENESGQGFTPEPENEPKARKPSGRKKKFIAAGAVTALAAVAVIGGILAYQTKSEWDDNIFTIGHVEIEASEPNFPTKDDPEEGRTDGVPDECELVIPHETIPKDPRIKNVGINDAVVFFRVTVPAEILNLINDDGTRVKNVEEDLFWMKTKDTPDETHANNFNPNWIELNSLDKKLVDCEGVNDEGRGKTYIFGWHNILNPSKSTETLFDKVQNKKYGSRTIGPDEIEQFKIESFAIQSEFIKRAGIDVPTTGEISEEDLTYIYQVFINQNVDAVGGQTWDKDSIDPTPATPSDVPMPPAASDRPATNSDVQD